MTDASSSTVLTSVEDGVLEIALNQPERRNPIDYATISALLGLLEGADADEGVRCVLLRGEGKGFCAGGDLDEFRGETSHSAYQLDVSGEPLARLMVLIPELDTPVVVAAHGFAMAGGCGLVAAADVALAAEGTRFAVSEVKIGLFPLMVLPTLQAAIGSRRARELALTGRSLEASEAREIGLVHRVVPATDLIPTARHAARELAGYGRATLAMGKAHLRQVEGMPAAAAVAFGRAKRSAFMTSPDFAEGVSAFLEKRPARFR